jgi:hypothetical protein
MASWENPFWLSAAIYEPHLYKRNFRGYPREYKQRILLLGNLAVITHILEINLEDYV